MKSNSSDRILAGFFTLAGAAGWALMPKVYACAIRDSSQFTLAGSWGKFVLYWGVVAAAMIIAGGFLFFRLRRSPDSKLSPRYMLFGAIILIAVQVLWFVFLLPYRYPCSIPFWSG